MSKYDNKITVYDYDKNIKQVYELIKKETSKENAELIFKYDRHMATQTLSKAVRLLHLKRLLSLTRLLNMDWKDVTQNDIEKLVYDVMNHHSENGQETNYTYDHKKILKIFFRWYKLGSRDFKEVGDPPETKIVKMRRVK
ncbi:MAG: tyrosine-type recombinase/integrase, partial [Nitrosopumilaceae archaeon]